VNAKSASHDILFADNVVDPQALNEVDPASKLDYSSRLSQRHAVFASHNLFLVAVQKTSLR